MQKPNPLNNDWDLVHCAVSANSPTLVQAMLHVADACAAALRNLPGEPLTAEEQSILDDELEEDPRFFEIMLKSETITSTENVLKGYEQGIASVEDFFSGKQVDYEILADISVQCWDYFVPEQLYSQLAHMTALVVAQIVSTQPDYHVRTWLFRISDSERWTLFLELAQHLDVLEPDQVRKLATRLAR